MLALVPFRSLKRRRRLTSLVGLSLDGSRLEAVWLRRTNGSLVVARTLSSSLALDPLTAAPELVGREIRNQLEAAGIRERECAVGLPLKWALTAHVEIPNLSDSDLESFLAIEAERSFPCDPATLQICTSRFQAAGKQYALQVGIPRTHLVSLEKVLRAAKLKPLTFTLAAASSAGTHAGDMSLHIGESAISLQIVAGGGVAALRSLEGAVATETGRPQLHAETVARETRITLGQLPEELRQAIQTIRIFGPRDLAQQLADEVELRLEAAGLRVEVVTRYAGTEFGPTLPPDTLVSPAITVAADRLAGRLNNFEFLPPRLTAFQRLAARYSSGRLQAVGGAALLLLAAVVGLFAYQQWQLNRLARQWASMALRVSELETVSSQIKQYRPWFDNSFKSMAILKQLTTAFPEDGVVSAKTVELRDGRHVTCTGIARDNQSLLKTLDRLRAFDSVSDLKVDSIRGKSPMQFTFNFQWDPGGRSEN